MGTVGVIETVLIPRIVVAPGRRPLKSIAELAASIDSLGLLNPITLTSDYRLIAGYHRLEACKSLGWQAIPANVLPLGELEAELAEIDENLQRNELTALERGEQLARRKAIYEALHPETRHGYGPGRGHTEKSGNDFHSFADDTATKTGQTPRSVRQDVQIATKIAPEVRDAIRETELADSKTDLLTLARVEPERQMAVVEQVLRGEVKDVREAAREARRTERIERERSRPVPATIPEGVTLAVADAAALPLADSLIDLIVTSPPYGLDKEYGSEDSADAWLEKLRVWLGEMLRVTKEHGRLAINVPLDTTAGGFRPTYPQAVNAALEAGWRYRSAIVWLEGNISKSVARGSVDSPASPHVIAPVEMIALFSKGEWARKAESAPDLGHDEWLEWTNGLWTLTGESRPWEGHPAPFPVELPRRLIKLLSFPGDTVLDPFVGSGTSAVAALELGRKFCGFDLNPEFVASAKRRLTVTREATDGLD